MELLQSKVVMLPLNRLTTFLDHPFQVRDDERMVQLVESISKVGVLTPVTVRCIDVGTWQIVSGHRRIHACNKLGMDIIPAIVREMNENEAAVAMVDSNFQREFLLPSEKAKAYKMKLDAVKRQGTRRGTDHTYMECKCCK